MLKRLKRNVSLFHNKIQIFHISVIHLPVKTVTLSFKSADCEDDDAPGLAAMSDDGDNSLMFSLSDEIDVDGDA